MTKVPTIAGGYRSVESAFPVTYALTMRRAKIVFTLGPATDSPEQVQALVDAGMNVCRINRSHGRAEDQEVLIARVRDAAQASGRSIS